MLHIKADSAIVIGDIAGRSEAFKKLVMDHPGRTVIGVGDMIDRGPGSRQVLDWFMANPGAIAIQGNHESMAIDASRSPHTQQTWLANGGYATLESLGGKLPLPSKYVDWMDGLPRSVSLECGGDKFFISHAFFSGISSGDPTPEEEGELMFVWDRSRPVRCDRYKLQLAGHMGKHFQIENAVCVDGSHNRHVGAMLLPECKFIVQPWLQGDSK